MYTLFFHGLLNLILKKNEDYGEWWVASFNELRPIFSGGKLRTHYVNLDESSFINHYEHCKKDEILNVTMKELTFSEVIIDELLSKLVQKKNGS